jgi:hypothetical protein
MQEQILNLIAEFTAEADQIAQELRTSLPHEDPERHLHISRRHGELLRWISVCERHLQPVA